MSPHPHLSPHLSTSLSTLLLPPSPTDPLSACGPPILSLLPTHPSSLLRLARSQLYTWPYAQVPPCWRRLFVDASIIHAIHLTQQELGLRPPDEGAVLEDGAAVPRRHGDGDGADWVQKIVNLLDMAIIMAGAEGRRDMIETLLGALQRYLSDADGGRQCKHRKLSAGDAMYNDSEGASRHKRRRLSPSAAPSPYTTTFPPSPHPQQIPKIGHPISSVSNLPLRDFEQHLAGQMGPLKIRHALEHWPALHERPWRCPGYLLERTMGGRRLVPVEVGRSYTDEGWGQRIVRFGEFVEEFLMPGVEIEGEGEMGEGGVGEVDKESDGEMANGHEPENDGEELGQLAKGGIGYLAQHDLFSQIPSLRNDISIPDYCYSNPPPVSKDIIKEPPSHLSEPLLNAWFGPAGTVSPLHTDPYYNILCQVVGKKYVRLYNPDQNDKLYPRGKEGGVDMSNTSEVDAEGDETELDESFPLFRGARYVETILQEGECLYIPVGWWHYVRSLTVSFSVSFWWN